MDHRIDDVLGGLAQGMSDGWRILPCGIGRDIVISIEGIRAAKDAIDFGHGGFGVPVRDHDARPAPLLTRNIDQEFLARAAPSRAKSSEGIHAGMGGNDAITRGEHHFIREKVEFANGLFIGPNADVSAVGLQVVHDEVLNVSRAAFGFNAAV